MATALAQEVLVIIDMQPRFYTSAKLSTQQAIIKQIKEAKKNDTPVVLLEYAYEGDTLSNIRRSLGKHPYYTLKKHRDSGASVLVPLLEKLRKRGKFILKLCGVNTGACVYRTVKDLTEVSLVKEIQIIWKGCNDPWDSKPHIFERFKNCRVVI
jgi:nicotinamidase-related amidase